jgi:hypothetical protein
MGRRVLFMAMIALSGLSVVAMLFTVRWSLSVTVPRGSLWIANSQFTVSWFSKPPGPARRRYDVGVFGKADLEPGPSYVLPTYVEGHRSFHSIFLPLWLPAVGRAVLATLFPPRRRLDPLTCPGCGYARLGLDAVARCPKCGTKGGPFSDTRQKPPS